MSCNFHLSIKWKLINFEKRPGVVVHWVSGTDERPNGLIPMIFSWTRVDRVVKNWVHGNINLHFHKFYQVHFLAFSGLLNVFAWYLSHFKCFKMSNVNIQCVSNMMTIILTRNSQKVSSAPSVRGNAYETRITVDKEVGKLLVPNHMENASVVIKYLRWKEFLIQTVIEHAMVNLKCKNKFKIMRPSRNILFTLLLEWDDLELNSFVFTGLDGNISAWLIL